MDFSKKIIFQKLKDDFGIEPDEQEINNATKRFDSFDGMVSKDATCVFVVLEGTALGTKRIIATLQDMAASGKNLGGLEIMTSLGSDLINIIGTAFSYGYTIATLRAEEAYENAPAAAAEAIRKAQQQ